MRDTRLRSICCCILFVCCMPSSSANALEDVTVLTIRPEKLQKRLAPGLTVTTVRDPFNWPTGQIETFNFRDRRHRITPFADLTLSGIILVKKRPLAIINGKLVGVGEQINNATVITIEKNQVKVASDGTSHTLRFDPVALELGNAEGNN